MSGGVEESYSLKEITSLTARNNNNEDVTQTIDQKTFWGILDNAEKKCSVIGCNIDVKIFLLLFDKDRFKLIKILV